MIPIQLKPIPDLNKFLRKVKNPGQDFLSHVPHPTQKQWSEHSYWRKVLRDLHSTYNGICAYSCHWIPPDTGACTVEHYKPKSIYPDLAYEWSNFRLVCSKLNSRKVQFEDVLDPFSLQEGWFCIHFPSLLVYPAEFLAEDDTQKVNRSIERLGLNEEATCLQRRERFVRDYVTRNISFHFLKRDAPFLAKEIERQQLIDTDLPVWAGFSQKLLDE